MLSFLPSIHEGVHVDSSDIHHDTSTQDTVPQQALPSLLGVRRTQMLPHFLAALEGLQASEPSERTRYSEAERHGQILAL